MALYPEDLPSPSAADYQVSSSSQVVSTDMEIGHARVRRRTAVRRDVVNVQWVLTDRQVQTFRGWYDHDLDGGVEWFSGLSLPVGDGGNTISDLRFSTSWVAEQLALDLWIVRATLEVGL